MRKIVLLMAFLVLPSGPAWAENAVLSPDPTSAVDRMFNYRSDYRYEYAVTEKFGRGGRWESELTGWSGAAQFASVLLGAGNQAHQTQKLVELEKLRLMVRLLESLPDDQRAEFLRKVLRADP